MRIAYLRVSTDEQSIEMQKHSLREYGIEKWVADEGVSGKNMDRPGFKYLDDILRDGDILYIYSLSRLGRNTVDILSYVDSLEKRGVSLCSHTEKFDTQTPMGKAFFTIIAALGQMERELTMERSRAGIALAREKGVKFGRKEKLNLDEKLMIQKADAPAAHLAKIFNVSKRTIQRIKKEGS